MSQIPENLKYTDQHEWVRMEGDTAVMGITDYAQSALGELVYVELPEVGRQVKKGDEVVVVESVKAASEVYAPVSGEIVEVNSALNDTPNLINDAPFAEGWTCKIKPSDTAELDSLLDAAAYGKLAG